ncbi:zincin, partial [Aureobasidium melanogenum]
MLKPPPIRPWTCAKCLRHEPRRRLATAATSAPPPLVSHTDPNTSHQDATLRQIFDSQPFWKEFSARQTHPSKKSLGLFQNRYLTRPEGFEHFASITLAKCKRIVTKVLAYSSAEQYKNIAKDLDRLSDLLCRVIDLSDFVRSTHPDRNIQAAATQAYAQMFEYMNV